MEYLPFLGGSSRWGTKGGTFHTPEGMVGGTPATPKDQRAGVPETIPGGGISPPRSPPRGRETPTPDIGAHYPWVFVSDIPQKTINPKKEYFWDIYSQQSIRTL